MAFNKDKVMDAARKFVEKGQLDKAVKEYLRIVQEDPQDVRVWLKLGDLYAKKGAKQEAIETYLKIARYYQEQAFLDKAIAVFERILRLDPRLVDVHLRLAELYRQLGMVAEAIGEYEAVAAHFHREGKNQEALATVKKIVDLDPENIATRIKLAELYSKESRVADAAAEFSMAIDQLRRLGRQDDFIKVAERLLWHKPDHHALGRELAGLYLRRNDPRRALQKLQVCYKADPRDLDTLGLLAVAFQALDQKAKTVSVLKELARLHLENKARDQAAEVFRKILEFVPGDPDALKHLGLDAKAAPEPAPVNLAELYAADPRGAFAAEAPPAPPSTRMTGSMPLVDESALAGADFELPSYDDADFAADLEPARDARQASAGEVHADEIAKILGESDVYVKYGLHQKAVDHLRRVFALDPDNVEAHERLKEILLVQGREREAEAELLKLADLVAQDDPDRAEAYLRELLAINGTNTGAFELARRHRLRVARGAPEPSRRGAAPASAAREAPRDSVDDFDPRDFIGAAQGSPAPARPPGPPGYAGDEPPAARPGSDGDDLEFDFASSVAAQQTRQLSASEAHQLVMAAAPGRGAAAPQAYLPAIESGPTSIAPPPSVVAATPARRGTAEARLELVEARGAGARPSTWSARRDAVDAQLDDDLLGKDIDQQVAAELGHEPEDLPFDLEAARAFDAGVARARTGAPPAGGGAVLPARHPHEPTGFEETGGDYTSEGPPGGFELDRTGLSSGFALDDELALPPAEAPALSFEDELDHADHYLGHGAYAEAHAVLESMLGRYPGHKLLLAKLGDVEAALAGHDALGDAAAELDPGYAGARGAVAASPAPADVAPDGASLDGLDPLALDEIEDLDDLVEAADGEDLEEELPEELPARPSGPYARTPAVLLESPVEEGDAETHYDLGLAYKEMGLYDEAIKAFEKTLVAPHREVQCRLMIGMCLREQGNLDTAVTQFKHALHAERVSERESQSLYYEIGLTYESMRDDAEALYYFDLVLKRDPDFADAEARAEQLRERLGY